jgi:S-adenosylmethionine:tRNA ribosyltransferase-isomerase
MMSSIYLEEKTQTGQFPSQPFSYPASLPGSGSLEFKLPLHLEAGEPPEARGLERDQVRLMVSYRANDAVYHTRFRQLPDFLQAGDVLAINTSGTLNAALLVKRQDGAVLELHLSTLLPSGMRVVELRLPGVQGTQPFYTARAGEELNLPGGGQAHLLTPYRPAGPYQPTGSSPAQTEPDRVRLWIANLELPCPIFEYLACYGFPIRYRYVRQEWPLSYYQTVYTTQPGSAEMPSAGRAFTPELIARLVASGIQFAPLLLHTGVASLEDHEPPYKEYYHMPVETARLVNAARANGRRVIAVGTTVVRALETVTSPDGETHAGEGWTSLVITPERGLRAVSGLLTGLHEPRSTHLAMLRALAGLEHLQITYQQALENNYLWHEFGDLHLIL